MSLNKIKTKPFILTIEGADKTGKDSVRDNLIKKTNGNLLIIVRSFISQIVYSQIYKRKIDYSFFLSRLAQSISDNENYVLLICSNKDEIEKRFYENEEKDIQVKDFFIQQEQFINFVQKFNSSIKRAKDKNIFIVDTYNKTIEEVSSEIINYFNLEI